MGRTSRVQHRWHSSEDEGCDDGYKELNNPKDQGYRLALRLAFCNCDVKGRICCEAKCDCEEEEATGKVGSVVPGGGYIGKFGDGGSDHDYGGYRTTKSGC